MEKTLESKWVYKGSIINLRLDKVQLENGNTSIREIVEHPGAVVIIPLKDSGEIVLVEQYRKAVDKPLLELPAGKLETGEDPRDCAKRELAEETGYRAKSVKYLSSFYTSPGFSNEVMHIFLATELEHGDKNLDEDEIIETIEVNRDEALDMALRGEIEDAKTLTGILILKAIK